MPENSVGQVVRNSFFLEVLTGQSTRTSLAVIRNADLLRNKLFFLLGREKKCLFTVTRPYLDFGGKKKKLGSAQKNPLKKILNGDQNTIICYADVLICRHL